MTEKQMVGKLLQALGTKREDVAKELLRLRCKGGRSVGETCPVAVYLKKRGVRDPNVTRHTIYFDLLDVDDAPYGDSVKTPGPVRAFLDAFDSGEYPKLILPEAS